MWRYGSIRLTKRLENTGSSVETMPGGKKILDIINI